MIGIIFETASPFDTPKRMAELLTWLKDARELRRLHPILIIAVFIVVFLEIHPFQDGNGRLSRVLTTLLLLQAGYSYVSYSSLETVIEHNKEAYYLALRQTQGTIRIDTPNWQPWLLFFIRALQQQKRNLGIKIEREKLVIAALPDLAIMIWSKRQGLARTLSKNISATMLQRSYWCSMVGVDRHGTPCCNIKKCCKIPSSSYLLTTHQRTVAYPE